MHTQSLGSRRVGSICRLLTLLFQVAFIAVCFFFAENSSLCDQKQRAMKTPKQKFRKNQENSPVFKEFFLGLASFRQSVLPCRQYVEGFPEFSTCLSDLSPNLTKSSPARWPVHLLLKIQKNKHWFIALVKSH